jgi:hypothetical protein
MSLSMLSTCKSLVFIPCLLSAVHRAGNKVKFIDNDSYVGYFHGYFYKDGVDK